MQSQSAYTADCVTHAAALAALLLEEGRAPWIARLRDVQPRGSSELWAPLTPIRFQTSTWNTHYVCCADDEAYDPLVGAPIAIADYAVAVFGRDIALVEHFSPTATADLVRRDALKAAFRPGYRR